MTEAATPPPPRMSTLTFRVAVAVMVVVYLALGVFYSRTLITWDDESSFLALGQMALTGRYSVQDEMTGQRMPLPFYVLGASQEIFGRNLWAARLVSLGIGLVALLTTVAVARRVWRRHDGVLEDCSSRRKAPLSGTSRRPRTTPSRPSYCDGRVDIAERGNAVARSDRDDHGVGPLLHSNESFSALPFFLVWASACPRPGRASRRRAHHVVPPVLFLAPIPRI